MDFSEWEPYYLDIVKEFGFSPEDDHRSAKILSELCRGKMICDPACLGRRIDSEVTILGDGLNLEEQLMTADLRGTIITADGATSKLLKIRGIVPDIIVTDLDGDVSDQLIANSRGAVVAILAHGDNVGKIEEYAWRFLGPITPTTQGRPFDQVCNYGGFTDGDRAVIMARHFGATRIRLWGFEMSEPRPKDGRNPRVKRKKLAYARKLIWELNPDGVEIIL